MKMISNNELKYIQSFAHKKHWAEETVYIIEGPKLLEEALKANCAIEKIYATSAWLDQQGLLGVPVETVDEVMLARMSQLNTPNQVIALVKKQQTALMPFDKTFTLLLDGIQDPGNLGTIIRTADWFGIQQIIVTSDTASIYNPKVIQSTMGSCFRVMVNVADVETVLATNKLPVLGALLTGDTVYKTQLPAIGFLLIGNESKGIRENLKQFITNPIAIPKFGGAESLNAAVATGILLSHWRNR
jgi:TrmH family RNA methyltransferase